MSNRPEPILNYKGDVKKLVRDILTNRGNLTYDIFATGVWKLLGRNDTADATIPQHLRKKDWGDDPKPNTNFVQPEKPNVNVNLSPTINIVYSSPRKIYDSNDNNFNNNSSRPSSNLEIAETEEILGQSETKIVIGSPVKVAQVLEQQEFGRLLHNPISNEKTTVRQVIDTSLGKKLEKLNQENFEKFVDYLSEDEDSSLFDASMIVVPESIRGLAGKLGLMFGTDTIRLLAYYCTTASLNTFIGVSDSIPLNYKIKTEVPDYNFDKIELTNINFSKQQDIRKLMLGELDNSGVFWESYLLESLEDSWDDRRDLELSTRPQSLVDVIRYLLAQTHRRLGLADYPIFTPESLTDDLESGDKERFNESKTLSDFLIWQLKALDGIFGQFPINIQIEDNDLIKTGDQPINIQLPNLAETLAELTGKMLTNEALINAILTINLKNIAETGSTKQTSIQNHYLLTAIQEYLGFKTTQKSTEVDLLFNPGVILKKTEEQSLTEAIKNSTVKVPIEVNDDEDSLEEQLKILTEAARISKAVHWRGVDLQGDVFSQLKSIFTNASNLSQDLSDKDKDKLEEFLNSLELGFSDKSGAIPPNKPFGRDYNRRPRVKKLKTDEQNP